MKSVTVLLDIGLSLFTLLVIATDGPPTEARFVVFTLFLVLVPALSAAVILRPPRAGALQSAVPAMLVRACNLVLLAAATWIVVTELPSHPSDPGLIPFVAVIFLAPLTTLVFLGRGSNHASRA